MKAVVISNGNVEDKAFYEEYLNKADFVICCDGGANVAYKYGFLPNLIIGDFDSVDKNVLEYFRSKNVEILEYPREKDKTDTQIAVEYLAGKDFDEVIMLSCTGKRIDHVLANITLLYYLLERNIKSFIADRNNIITMTKDKIKIEGKKGSILSLLPYTKTVRGISTKGLYYPLKDGSMEFGNPYGISNVIIEDEAIVEVKEGVLLVILSSD
ncbi:thiamine diphosphokinase [Caldicellulosiruptor naganoensis]|uniref:Thiamine diphosphokinase n=1 Tax=Caldicellulosiruptor naganoensis TaxID=29324 RepID=A0ABY7BIE4_9FIRM|nr:thiamine diphosphokinase [Caldicellulosiruptor naganoensis]WAM32369.1 thiamine diphosphokinase [Caldicellulosiruptor naganoensis]